MSDTDEVAELVSSVRHLLAAGGPAEPRPLDLYKAIRAARTVMRDVGKSGHNDFDNYDYSSLFDYITASDAALAANGLHLAIRRIRPEWSTSHSEKMRSRVVVHIEGELIHCETGQSITAEGWGEAFDKGDKALYKAITGARKYLIACLFNIYTGDDPETESVPENEKRTARGKANPYRQPQPPRAAKPDAKSETKKSAAQYVAAAKTPVELTNLLLKLRSQKDVPADPAAWRKIWKAAVDHLAKKNWQGEATQVLETTLADIGETIAQCELDEQSRQACGGEEAGAKG